MPRNIRRTNEELSDDAEVIEMVAKWSHVEDVVKIIITVRMI